MRRAVLYSRVSSQMQGDFGVSLEMQEDMARKHCEREGWEFCGTYTDVMSGGRDARPELLRLEEDAGKKKFDVLLVYKMDRLARSLLRLLQIAADFSDRGIGLTSLTEPIDFTTPMGRALLAMLGAFAEMEAQNIATRVRDSLRLVAARGGNTGGYTRLLGYRYDADANILRLVPEEAETVKALYDAYLDKQTYRAAAAWANENGLTTLEGNTFSVQALREILTNPVYTGMVVWGRRAYKKNSKGNRRQEVQPQDRWIVHKDAHEAIIPLEVWEKAQELGKRNATLHPRRVYGMKYAWSGLIVCSGCGGPTARFNTGGRIRRDGHKTRITGYECISRKNKGHSYCESACYLSDTFLNVMVIPEIAKVLEGATGTRPKASKPKKAPARSHASEIDNLQAQTARAWEMYVAGRPGWTFDRCKVIEDENNAKIEALTKPEPEAATVIPIPRIKNFAGAWENASEASRGEILRLYVENVEANQEEVTITFAPGVEADPITVKRVKMSGYYGKQRKGLPRGL